LTRPHLAAYNQVASYYPFGFLDTSQNENEIDLESVAQIAGETSIG
jgi:hypothetical protein